jgi:hypothetical protein
VGIGMRTPTYHFFSRLRLILGLIALIIALLYVNYNLPIFKQIFANQFYVSVEASSVDAPKIRNGFSCLSVNVARTPSIFDQNKAYLLGGMIGSNKYSYEIANRLYESEGYSYLKNHMACNQIISAISYFPIFPNWSVINNDFPSGTHWKNFLNSTKCLLIYLLLYVIYLIGIKYIKFKKTSVSETQNNIDKNLLIIAFFLPFIILTIFMITQVHEVLENYIRASKNLNVIGFRYFLETVLGFSFYMLILFPSIFIFFKISKKYNRRYINLSILILSLLFFNYVLLTILSRVIWILF